MVANTQGLDCWWVPRLEKCGAPHWTAAGFSAAADAPPGTACARSTCSRHLRAGKPELLCGFQKVTSVKVRI